MIREFLSKSSSRYSIQRLGFVILTLIAVITVVPIIAIIVHIFMQGISAISWEFLTSFPRDGMQAGGIFPAIVGTFFLTLGTAILSIPLSIGAAIYLAEYAPDNRWTRAIRIAIINLAGIPSVVYGLFGLGLFVIFLNFGTSIFAGCLTFWHPDGCNTWIRTSSWGNSTNIIYSRGILFTAATQLAFRSHDGFAVSFVCRLHPGTGYADRVAIRNSSGTAHLYYRDEYPCHDHPLSSPSKTTMVIPNRW